VRIRARFHSAQLDRSLAQGTDRLASPELRWRGQQLISRRYRRRLAREIDRVLKAAKKRPLLGGSAAPLSRVEIASCRDLLLALAGELREAEPVEVRGMALVANLLHDGHSPLYYAPDALQGELEAELRRARAALQLR
jgi:hypothetical protein